MRGFGGDIEGLGAAIDQEIPVADAVVEFEAGEVEGAREVGDEALGFGVGDAAGGVILHDAVDDGNEVAAEDPVGRGKRNVVWYFNAI